MKRIVLVSFADRRYRNAMKRLDIASANFPFTERHFCDETNTFDKKYWRKLKPWLYRRGFGYWEWKGLVVKKYFDQLEEDDILVWSDVGVYWNSNDNSLKRFDYYIDLLRKGDNLLAFQEPYIEQEWTKGDLLYYFGVYNNEEICKSNQLWSGVFFLKKTIDTTKLVNDWSLVNMRELELETDKRSSMPNKDGFKEHRHDQSSFSVLVKLIPHIELSWKETQVIDRSDIKSWDKLYEYPIQARRTKLENRPLGEIIKNKFLRPWRFCLNVYFRKIKKYEFLSPGYPW